jgi:hypothetical protein
MYRSTSLKKIKFCVKLLLCKKAAAAKTWTTQIKISYQNYKIYCTVYSIYCTLKGIVSRNKMTFGRFQCIAGHFLMIRCRILNFKNFDFILMVKKYSVRRFVPSPVHVLDKFFRKTRDFSHCTVKNLSPCGKSSKRV